MTEPTPVEAIDPPAADAPATEAPAAEPTTTDVEYIEHKGDPTYGTEFLSSHTITPAQAKEAGWLVELKEPIVWLRREAGRLKGRMLVKVSDVPDGVKEELANDPQFKVVTLKQ